MIISYLIKNSRNKERFRIWIIVCWIIWLYLSDFDGHVPRWTESRRHAKVRSSLGHPVKSFAKHLPQVMTATVHQMDFGPPRQSRLDSDAIQSVNEHNLASIELRCNCIDEKIGINSRLVRTARLGFQTSPEHLVVVVEPEQGHEAVGHDVQLGAGDVVSKNRLRRVEEQHLRVCLCLRQSLPNCFVPTLTSSITVCSRPKKTLAESVTLM